MAYFEECDAILNNIIGEKILRNQNICKLLYYYPECTDYSYDPLSQPDIKDTSVLLMEHVFPMPKLPDLETEQKGYMTVTISGGDKYSYDSNDGYRRINIIFDIIVHLKSWMIKDSYRVYKIAEEIDKMLNYQQTDLPIINRPIYYGFKSRDYSNYFYGLQLVYQFVVNSNIECAPIPQNLNIKKSEDEDCECNSMCFSKVLNRR